MTKKDYVILAEALRQNIGGGYVEIVDAIADALYRDNEKFDYDRFYDACGIALREFCPKYPNDKVLPDEKGLCSLCGEHKA